MSKKLLIVDDSRVSRMLIRGFVLDQRPDWVCVEASNGEEAVQKVQSESFDYATVDINMPGIDGFEVVARFHTIVPELKVSLLSSNIQEDSLRRAQSLSVGFVRKPITEEGIAQAIAYFEASA